MAYGLPERGQPDWDDELNNSMEYLRGQAESAKAASDNAVSTANNALSAAQEALAATEAADYAAIDERVDDLEATVAGIDIQEGPRGLDRLPFEFPSPATGETSQLWYLPESTSVIHPPYLQTDTPPVGAPVVVDIEADTGFGFSSILSAPITFPEGENYLLGETPVIQNLEAGSLMRCKIVSAPIEVDSTLAANTATAGTNSAAAAVASITLQKPTGAATGDLLIAFVARQNQTLTVSSDWTVIADFPTDDTTPQARLAVLAAINSPTLSMSCGLSSGTPALSCVVAMTGYDTLDPFTTPSVFRGNNAGATITLPAYTTGDDAGDTGEVDEHVFLVALSRYGAADEGRVHNWTGTSASVYDAITSRGSGNTDLRMSIRHLAANQADETTLEAMTVGDVTGSSFTSWVAYAVGVKQGLSAGTAGRLNVQVVLR